MSGREFRAITILKQHNFGVIVDVAQPPKVVRTSHLLYTGKELPREYNM